LMLMLLTHKFAAQHLLIFSIDR